MSEAIEVEVPGPKVRALVSVERLEQYLRRTGWSIGYVRAGWHPWVQACHLVYVPLVETERREWFMRQAIIDIAMSEKRAPHLVLADIAAEVVGSDCAAAAIG